MSKGRERTMAQILRLCNTQPLDYGTRRVIESSLASNVALYWPSWWWKVDYAVRCWPVIVKMWFGNMTAKLREGGKA
jgi:hypothetical protein